MFLIKTRVGPSAIHGTGVFSCDAVAAGEPVWRFHPPFDRVIDDSDLATLPPAALHHLETYAYRATDLGGRLVLSGDHARFLNHDPDPNTQEEPFVSVARRAIQPGDEITCDYGAFCDGWTGFGDAAAPPSPPQLPHEHLFTRIKRAAQGVGVFAIRDIPAGTALFVGDTGATVRIPEAQVAAIADREIRRMYLDFCPVVDGAHVCPADFNAITMGWYLNHADRPNVVTRPGGLQFIAAMDIAAGEELTADYRTYSARASAFIRDGWTSPLLS